MTRETGRADGRTRAAEGGSRRGARYGADVAEGITEPPGRYPYEGEPDVHEPDPSHYEEYGFGSGRREVQFGVTMHEWLLPEEFPREGDRLKIEGRWFTVRSSYPVTKKHKASAHSIYDVFDYQRIDLVQETVLSRSHNEARAKFEAEPPAARGFLVRAEWNEGPEADFPAVGETVRLAVGGAAREFVVSQRNPWFLHLVDRVHRERTIRGPGGRPGRVGPVGPEGPDGPEGAQDSE